MGKEMITLFSAWDEGVERKRYTYIRGFPASSVRPYDR